MVLSFKKIGLVVLALTYTQVVLAYDYCSQQNLNSGHLHNAGFFLTSKQLNILKTDRTLDKNKKIPIAVIEERVYNAIVKAGSKIPEAKKTELAKTITRAATSIGVDFQQLSGMVHKESTFCTDRSNGRSGAAGCTQFTSIALQELKDQFSDNKKIRSQAAPAVMRELVAKYFVEAPTREKVFYAWLGSSKKSMQNALKGTSNYDIDVLAGALLLKIYLSRTGGNYYKAFVQYNGDSQRFAYAQNVQGKASKVSDDESIICAGAVSETTQMIEESCDLFENNAYGCFDDKMLNPTEQPEQLI